jgi:uncharacterized repeat protein (TIGR01451 family)
MSPHSVPGPGRGRARAAARRVVRLAAVACAVATVALLAPRPARAIPLRDAAAPAPKSDVQITAVASAGFASGFNATYTLTVVNNGPQTAVGPFTVTNTLPAGLTYSSGSGTGWTCGAAGQVVTCTLAGSLAKSVPTTISIVAFITSSVATSVTNVASVAYPGNDDSDLTNNTASTTSAVTVRRVATTPDGATTSNLPSNGTTYTQTFVVANIGNVSDSYTLVASVAPAGVVSVVSVDGTAGSNATTSPIAAAATRNVVVVYTVATGAATGATATLTLTATSTVTATSSNAGDLTVTVARAGITMAKALYRDDQATPVGAGAVGTDEYVQYRVTVTSTGSADATAVSVADMIPAQMTYDAAIGDVAGWSFATAGSTLTATLAGTLASGASRYFWIRVRVR